ncbi:unnamed protein product [Clonostachys rosea]|uniref:Xylanolytic transcriptional activator regulatory domain-containing protein n=1 Tax=Bionectria ochroleuca TaxID=29856 RepID=A0ABY6UPD9_BIOOC|nr:unnamed protein product [Clonostachys rosea]
MRQPTRRSLRVRNVVVGSKNVPEITRHVRIVFGRVKDIPCLYDAKKTKPGLKVGAVEALSKRVEALEQSFHDREQQEKGSQNTGHGGLTDNTAQLIGAVTALVSEIQGITTRRNQPDISAPIHSIAPQNPRNHDTVEQSHVPKRRRLSISQCVSPASSRSQPRPDLTDDHLTHDLVDEAVHLYFAKVFYWIPLIHRSRFKDQIKLPQGRKRLSVVIDAILVATLRFVDRHRHSLSEEDVIRLTTEKRKSVLIAAMDDLSIENLQALVILAFTDIGHGTPNRSWSIIGSMTRTAEYLQLTTEESQRNKTSTRRLSPLPTTDDWVEQEERRRIFWNIFNLDRWDVIIDTNKINLKLPANGSYWYAEEPVGCPYFNIGDRSGIEKADKSSARTSDQSRSDNPGDAGSPVLSSESSGGSWLGGFAYCIEASEYLRRISTFVLHQDVNFANQKDVRSWLTRFKELDLQLVHWKMFLPRKWSDPNRAPNTSTGPRDLDHNMTLAHVTHNTSMILLHHRIAYPPAGWCPNVPLPSACSAETCRLAATKTSNIMEKWLSICPEEIIVAPQMALCTFISARLLLLHWRNDNKKLDSEFWVLVRSLEHMSRRWEGPRTSNVERPPNLAGTYAINLRKLLERCNAEPGLEIDLIDYQDDLFCSRASSTPNDIPDRHTQPTHHLGVSDAGSSQAALSVPSNLGSAAFDDSTGPLVPSTHPENVSSGQAQSSSTYHLPLPGPSTHERTHISVGNGSSYSLNATSPYPPADLLEISQALMDQRFSEMDRIITLDDSFFEAAALAPNMPLLPISEWNAENINGQYYSNGGRSI